MEDSKILSELIKRYIKMRGRTMLSVAEEIGTDYPPTYHLACEMITVDVGYSLFLLRMKKYMIAEQCQRKNI